MPIQAVIGTILRGRSGASVEGALLGVAAVFFGVTALQAHGANEACLGAGDHPTCGIHAKNPPQATDEPAAFPDGRTVVEFTSDYCPSCRKMEPVLADVIRRCGSSGVSLVRIDVESPSGGELAVHWRISNTPTIVLLDPKHAEAQRLIGLRPAAELRRAVEGALGVECSRG
ncbi:MAG: thioredoxin family protein [Polyangiaceae bacterium]|jgi:cytochrome c-type biogenesis protein